MAKSGFWLRGAKGKLAGTTLYQSGGRTLQREIVTPKNPQTDAQMKQRLNMAVCSKFYQDAQQQRFPLAFANKKTNQSNFNAFTQVNLLEFGTLIYPTKDQISNPAFCAYFPWVCSTGNLQGIEVAEADDQMEGIGALIYVSDEEGTPYTTWEEVIAANPTLNLQYGDIITVTAVLNDMTCPAGEIRIGSRAPIWVTRQFIIGANLGEGSLEDYLDLNGFDLYLTMQNPQRSAPMINLDKVYGSEEALYFGPDVDAANKTAMMCCVTRSRVENGKTLVSPSRFMLDDEAWKIALRLGYDSQLAAAIDSYKSKGTTSSSAYAQGLTETPPTEVLQGSVAKPAFKFDELDYTTSKGNDGTRKSFPTGKLDFRLDPWAGISEAPMSQHHAILYASDLMERSKWSVEGTYQGLTLNTSGATKMSDGRYMQDVRVIVLDSDRNNDNPYVVKYDGNTVFSGVMPKKA